MVRFDLKWDASALKHSNDALRFEWFEGTQLMQHFSRRLHVSFSPNETVGKGAFVEGMVAQGSVSKREEFFINADDKNVAS